LAKGDRVIATGRSLDALKAVHEDNDRLRLLELDITSGFDVLSRVAEAAIEVWGRVDVLVNNAGIGLLGLFEESG
jgi:NADP-dependent 3-hydroxy acid dehydrogenase YdfG